MSEGLGLWGVISSSSNYSTAGQRGEKGQTNESIKTAITEYMKPSDRPVCLETFLTSCRNKTLMHLSLTLITGTNSVFWLGGETGQSVWLVFEILECSLCKNKIKWVMMQIEHVCVEQILVKHLDLLFWRQGYFISTFLYTCNKL